MNLKISLMATAAATLLFVASPAMAQQAHGSNLNSAHMGQRMERHNAGMDMPGIASEKRDSIRQIQGDYRDRLFRLHQDIYGRSAALNAIMLQPQPDPVMAKAVAREISTLRVEEMDLLIEMHTRIARETGVRMPMSMGAGRMVMN